MKYFESILDVIGKTPLIRLGAMANGIKPAILIKAEYLNPGGSIKDRVGLQMVRAAMKRGDLKPGGTVVEPTSGNTGIGIAMASRQLGLKMVFTMPDKVSVEKENLLRAFGAEVIRCPTAVEPEDPRSYYEVAKRIVRERKGAYSPNQYANPDNPATHYQSTGPEIWNDTDGNVTHMVIGMGTGGTISGIGRYLKEKNPDIRIIGADPVGSIYYPRFYDTDDKIHTYKTEGVGEDFMPETIDLDLVDEVIRVSDRQAYQMARRFARSESMLTGSSGGTALHAALQVAEKLDEDSVVVVILPDTGRNYMSTVFNDDWMKKNDLL